MKDRYVLLTGSRNNAGDFLIKHRAMALLAALRPDREIVDYDGWKPLTDEQLAVINDSRALLLTGGPAVQKRMHPDVYPLRSDLDDIRVPIGTFGVGWSTTEGRWSDTRRMGFTAATTTLLERLERDGLALSVRDHHTQNALKVADVTSTAMTGCPALYSLPHLGTPFAVSDRPNTVSISLGTRFANNLPLERQARELVTRARSVFEGAELTVVFHHALDESFKRAYGHTGPLYGAQRRFAAWLEEQGVAYVDVSGSAERLIEHYSTADLHLGYRVHAHILMTSLRRPSLLLAEDGRGRALRDVLGGHVYDAFDSLRLKDARVRGVAVKLGFTSIAYAVPEGVATDAVDMLELDMLHGWPRARMAIDAVDARWPVMKRFIEALP